MKRLALELLGREVWAVSFGTPAEQHEPGTTASQIEMAEPVRLGFQIPINPSLTEVEP